MKVKAEWRDSIEDLPIVDDGTMMTWGPSSPSSIKCAMKEMACIVLPKPWRFIQ